MLKANAGISKKMSKDYNSQGFTLNLEGEIQATLDDPEAVIERVKELFDLAEEALDRQIAESQSIDAFARRDAEEQPEVRNNGPNRGHRLNTPEEAPPAPNGRSSAARPAGPEPATNKQVQFLTTLAKRQKLFGPKLESFIEETIGRICSPYDLSKKEAGSIIEALNPEGAQENRPRR
ncbi:hypothetical protein BH23PLA1_BH23PLA1_39040 [soil metagenome]